MSFLPIREGWEETGEMFFENMVVQNICGLREKVNKKFPKKQLVLNITTRVSVSKSGVSPLTDTSNLPHKKHVTSKELGS